MSEQIRSDLTSKSLPTNLLITAELNILHRIRCSSHLPIFFWVHGRAKSCCSLSQQHGDVTLMVFPVSIRIVTLAPNTCIFNVD